jgi:lipoate-protein ligase A
MQRLDLTLSTPQENLALDEALLDWAEDSDPDAEFFRLWESPQPFVVVGRSSRVDQEVNTAACSDRGLAVLRRSSGGAAVVVGPGCLMYSVILSYQLRPELKDVGRAHSYTLHRLADRLQMYVPNVMCAGTSDLVMIDETETARKFSGNSLRAKRSHFLYHGTLLYDFDLPLVTACLRIPPRQPNYRRARTHADFVCNLPLERQKLVEAVSVAFPTFEPAPAWPRAQVAKLVAERFSRDEWNLSFG